MRLKTTQIILLAVFVLSGTVMVLNQPAESTDVALPHPTMSEHRGYAIPDGPDIHITLPGLLQERPNIEEFLMIVIMICTIAGLLGSILVSKTRWGSEQ